MTPAHVVEIATPKGVLLNGLWFGPKRVKRVVIWVHGLSSTVFSKHELTTLLTDSSTAILMFNNRGHDKVSRIQKTNGRRIRGGAAHEVFTDCVDDIDGAVRFAKKQSKTVFLAGHSTGCQKAVYWTHRRKTGVAGVILLAPVSDYAATVMLDGKAAMKKANSHARTLIHTGRKHELLPENVWSWSLLADAQRYVSLYSGSSAEEVFPYWDKKRKPKTLRSVKRPLLVLLAEKDEYADRPAQELYDWFLSHIHEGEVVIIPKVEHSFKGGEKTVARYIGEFMKEAGR